MRNTPSPRSVVTFVFSLIAIAFTTSFVRAQDQPTIQKDSVQATAFTVNSYKGKFDTWSWLPKLNFTVNGPIQSGSRLYAEFSSPTGTPWVKFDCATEETRPGYWWRTECGGRDIGEDKSITALGVVGFNIKIRNELSGTDASLFTGKMKVVKAHSGEAGPKFVNHFVYFVDQDANLPVGYVWLTPDSIRGWDIPELQMAFWIRGDSYNLEPHLFFQGKEVGRSFVNGMDIGGGRCSVEVEINPTISVNEAHPQKAKWARVVCKFAAVRGHARNGAEKNFAGEPFLLANNPGEYEMKVIWNNKLARSLKFTVAPGGKFDNGIASSNKIGSDRVIIPVQIIGDQDGPWDRAAWKQVFYGNPLTGFTALP